MSHLSRQGNFVQIGPNERWVNISRIEFIEYWGGERPGKGTKRTQSIRVFLIGSENNILHEVVTDRTESKSRFMERILDELSG